MAEQQTYLQPHVLVIPFPAQGHIKPMLCFAQLLCQANLQVTFLNTHSNHRHLTATNLQLLSDRFPNLHFHSISDGLPEDHPRTAKHIGELILSINPAATPLLRELFSSFNRDRKKLPKTCVIADGLMFSAIDVAEELGFPVWCFRTASACSVLAYSALPKLIEDGIIPFQDEDMDLEINTIPAMEGVLRYRDLPSISRLQQSDHPILQFFINVTLAVNRSPSLILNTFEDLESPILSEISKNSSNIYSIGPIHALLESKSIDSISSHANLRSEDRDCIRWLDTQPARSVVYVSFGSLVTISRSDFMEFLRGLIDSGSPFLWVIRTDIFQEDDEQTKSDGLDWAVKERGYLLGWAPQEEVLAHKSVGCFLTHSGWNSTLEAIWAAIPMICWPIKADQQVNSRFVSEVWKMGVDMKDTCDRSTVEKMVRAVMGDQGKEFRKSTARIAKLARDSIKPGGSSYKNLEKLIADIRNEFAQTQIR